MNYQTKRLQASAKINIKNMSKNKKEMSTKLIKNVECFAIVQDETSGKFIIAIGKTAIASADSAAEAMGMIENKDWRLIAGIAGIIARIEIAGDKDEAAPLEVPKQIKTEVAK